MAAGMGDERRPLTAGDRWQPTASDVNAIHKAVDCVESTQRDGGAISRIHVRRELGTVVLVRNDSSTEEDWPAWSPVGVCAPPGEPHSAAPAFASRPYFRGCRLNDYSFDNGYYRMLGITQEPIASGKMGRVCIRGVTPALMLKMNGWSGPASREWVHVSYDSSADRWGLRCGPAGDARLLRFLDYTLYNADEYLVLIDLCDVPGRFVCSWYAIDGSAALPARSLVSSGVAPSSVGKFAAVMAGNWYPPWQRGTSVMASPAWEIPHGKYGFCYLADETIPICAATAFTGTAPYSDELWGPAPDDFRCWPGLPGFTRVAYDWYQSNFINFWLKKDLSRPAWMKAQSLFGQTESSARVACVCTYQMNGSPQGQAGVVYDGTTQGGVTYPQTLSRVQFPARPSGTVPRDLNIQAGRIFRARVNEYEGFFFGCDESVYDDPIGTVKLWISSNAIPPGWREFGYLQGRFPVGYVAGDADFGTFLGTGGAKTHTHPAGSGIASGSNLGAANHLPPFCTVKFIERYQ